MKAAHKTSLKQGFIMKARIKALNAAYEAGTISVESYRVKARSMLSALDWQSKVQYENLLYITIDF